MATRRTWREAITPFIKQVFTDYESSHCGGPFIPGETRLPLSTPAYGPEEVIEALDSLLSTYVTMGKKVNTFESIFADYIGVDHGVMVNSGSSANLVALTAMRSLGYLSPGDEIITPAVTWATTVYPIAQVGCIPVLVDVGADYNIDPYAIERAITPKTRAILPVHLMGNPCAMDAIMDIAVARNLLVIEDACEAHGAKVGDKMVGCIGDVGFFSFFFSHHISTIEGGMVVTSLSPLADACRSLRAFGWPREMELRDKVVAQYPDIDPRFLFLNPGFNLRPTEIQGAFGMHQLPKLEGIIEQRRGNAAYFNEHLGQFTDLILPEERPDTRHVWFGYPITVKFGASFSREDLVGFLESKGLETRPIGTGNMANQPVMKQIEHRVDGTLEQAQYIDQNGFFFGVHEGLTEEQREAIVFYFKEFFDVYPRD